MRNEAKSKEEKPLALNRMVRSAIAGSAGEPYCAYIIDRIQEVCDLSDWPLSEVEAPSWGGPLRSFCPCLLLVVVVSSAFRPVISLVVGLMLKLMIPLPAAVNHVQSVWVS